MEKTIKYIREPFSRNIYKLEVESEHTDADGKVMFLGRIDGRIVLMPSNSVASEEEFRKFTKLQKLLCLEKKIRDKIKEIGY
jgi:hypothetical protein